MSWAWKRLQGALTGQASTRSAALMRIGLVLLLWSRLSFAVRPVRDLYNPEQWLLSVGFYVFTPMLLVGAYTRVAAWGTAITGLAIYYWFGHHRGMEAWTHHHIYVLVVLSVLVALLPSGGSYSVDRWRLVRAAEARGEPPPPELGPSWGLLLVRVQITALYFWTAYDKCTLGFLSGERMEAIFMTLYLGSDYPQIPGFHAFMLLTSVGTVVLEFGLAFLPWFRRTRTPVLLAGVVLHGVIYYLLPVSTFTASMYLLYLAWYPPDQVHALLDRLQGHPSGER